MLTEKKPNGEWSVKDVDFKDCKGGMYGALCKLRDYEKTGLNPSDFRSDSYEKKYVYKVFCGTETVYCETKESAETMIKLLKKAGYDAHMNVWSWQAFIEE